MERDTQLDQFVSVFQAHKDVEKFALVVTVDGNSFSILMSDNKCLLADTHIHYLSRTQSNEDARTKSDCKGRAVLCVRKRSPLLFKYIVTTMLKAQRLDSSNGDVHIFIPLTNSSTNLDSVSPKKASLSSSR